MVVSENLSDIVSPTVVAMMVVDSQETGSEHGDGDTESVCYNGLK